MAGIFISYRRKDAAGHAGRLHDDLVQRYGRDAVFMDIDSLHGGQLFRQRIHEALDSSAIALVLIGEAWAAPSTQPGSGETRRRIDEEDDLVRREVTAALRHEDVAVVPVLVEGAPVPNAADLPEDLASLPDLQVCQLRNSEWRTDVRRICRAIDKAGAKPPWHQRARRGAKAVATRPLIVGAAVVAAIGIGAAILLSDGDPGPECVNRTIPDATRDALSAAAGSSQPAKEGSVYYGSCGSETWALATFPNGTEDVFVLNGANWVDLGPVAAAECRNVPSDLLEAWNRNDC